ncbi:MAG: PH domain-containing protein [Fimbriimonadaceae bacterium]|nr:PH domain-containing protein [Fimbriimonadaceae bacterium]
MFDQPRRLHIASIVIGVGTYIRHALWPLVAALYFSFKGSEDKSELVVLIVMACVGPLLLIGPILAYISTTFFIQADSLIIQKGVIWKQRRTIPLSRIQNVNIKQTVWHRIMKAAAVMVETAASNGVEGQLDALGIDDAHALQQILLQQAAIEEDAEKPPVQPELFSLTTKQILLSGALRNRALFIIAGVAGASQYEGLARGAFKPVVNLLSHTNPVIGALLSAAAFLGLIIVGWLLSIGYSALRFYGFRIERHTKGLMVTRGLLTHIRSIIPLGRVQQVRIVQPMFFRFFDYCEVFSYTAGSFDDKEAAGASNLCPILPIDDIERIGKLVFPDFAFFSLAWYQVSRKMIRRAAFGSFISLSIFIVTPLWFWLHSLAFFALPIIAVIAIMTGFLRYRYVGYALNENYIASRQGMLQKEVALMPIQRVQHYTLRRTLTQRWLGLASIDIFSAAATGSHIVIHDLDYDVALQVQQRLSEIYAKQGPHTLGGL